MSSNRDGVVDSVRGLSMMGILIAHAVVDPPDMTGHVVWSVGNGYCPMWFALISGMCLTLSTRSRLESVIRALSLCVVGVLLTSVSTSVLVVLPSLGIALAIAFYIPVRWRGAMGIMGLIATPVVGWIGASRLSVDTRVMDLGTVVHPSHLSALITGTYPVIEWTSLVLVGMCLSPDMLRRARTGVFSAGILCISIAIAVLIPGMSDRRYSHLVSVRTSFDPWWSMYIVPYGHTGSSLSLIIGISSLMMIFFLISRLPAIMLLTTWGKYSLLVYCVTCIILSATGPENGFTLWMVVVVMMSIVIIMMSRIGYPDPLHRGINTVSRVVSTRL